MCGGFEYKYQDAETLEIKTHKVFFPIPKARIPVRTEEGISFCQWGKREGEDPEIDVPVTGWARLSSLKEGKWNQYDPRRVKIPALRWMEKDAGKNSHWFDVTPGKGLLGVQIERKVAGESRRFVYIVTRTAMDDHAEIHDRMPLLTDFDGDDLPRISRDNVQHKLFSLPGISG